LLELEMRADAPHNRFARSLRESHARRLCRFRIWLVVALFFLGIALLALGLSAQVPPENAYNGFHLEGTIVSSELQSFESPGPPGAGPEPVCLLRIQPYFHVHLPEHPEVEVWVQGGGAALCLDWGRERRGDLVTVDGYLSRVEAGGVVRMALKPLNLDISGGG
jgi:hypothetical protein